jgi:adenylate kinase family enzyme
MEDATAALLQCVAVIGSPGGGKSTLAIALARSTGLPLVHLDREHWGANWTEPPEADWQRRNCELVAGQRWIIDGNYGSTLETRLERATMVVWLDLPTRDCLWGAVRRAVHYRLGGRPDMAEGCPERWDFEYLKFLHYIATFRPRKPAGIAQSLAARGLPVVHVRSPAERATLMRALAGPEAAQGIARLASSRMEMP